VTPVQLPTQSPAWQYSPAPQVTPAHRLVTQVPATHCCCALQYCGKVVQLSTRHSPSGPTHTSPTPQVTSSHARTQAPSSHTVLSPLGSGSQVTPKQVSTRQKLSTQTRPSGHGNSPDAHGSAH
jgi:hypothetical protein